VHVTLTPCFVLSHLQVAIAMLHWHMVMPFMMQQQLHIPSAIMLHRF
jgi:hypothetical protein